MALTRIFLAAILSAGSGSMMHADYNCKRRSPASALGARWCHGRPRHHSRVIRLTAPCPLEHSNLLARELGVENVEVGLVVQPERAVVEVGRAHRHQSSSTIITLQWYIVGWYS